MGGVFPLDRRHNLGILSSNMAIVDHKARHLYRRTCGSI